MITLALDASTYVGSVALLNGQAVLARRSTAMRSRESELLMPAIDETLRDAGCGMRDVRRIVCGAGPGSFTSLRIAGSLAKGLAVGRAIPMFAVSSLALIVAGNVPDAEQGPTKYLAVLDALRGESYTAPFEYYGGGVRPLGEMLRLEKDEVPHHARAIGATVVGPDEELPWPPRACGVARLQDLIERDGPVNLAVWEPVYGRLAEAQARWEAAHGRTLPGAAP